MPQIEIHNTRLFNAPCEQVYEAFAQPERLKEWWGPHGFTNTITKFDFRPGGEWHITMHGPDGADYPNESRFDAIQPNERIIFQHLRPMHWYEMTMTYEAAGPQTRLTWRMVLEQSDENLRDIITAANEQNLDRLAAHLAKG